ncbi:ABC transporter ATP-binding protein [Candidatus Magnetomorum sp. HK-1]|nr:ABC transporter ATP-binding protein [Candidatus Magnetomorum sp. HK-1]
MSPFNLFNSQGRFFIPEVIQTSSMDCGPAALKSVLEGFNISANYESLRTACQTDVSGTSIDTIEDIACQLGLDAEQVIIQKDHLLLSETKALPAIVVVCLPDGFTHFVVAWKTFGQMVQIMDPAVGRIWIPQARFLQTVYPYSHCVDKEIWQDYIKTEIFCDPLHRRMADLKIKHSEINRLIQEAQNNKDWRSMASLDASVRILQTIATSGSFLTGENAEKILKTYYDCSMNNPQEQIIPEEYFSVTPFKNDCQKLYLKGAILIHIEGKKDIHHAKEEESKISKTHLSSEVKAEINKKDVLPEKEFYKQITSDNKLLPIILGIGLTLAAFNVSIEALILMGFMSVGLELGNNLNQQSLTMLSIFIFFAAVLFIEWPINALKLLMGRRFEISMRLKFLLKIPKLGDQYFQTRPRADIAQRIHDMRLIRKMPDILISLFKNIIQIIITVIGIIWLMPSHPILPIIIGFIAVLTPIAALPFLKERDLQFRIFTGSLAQYCLDALTGLTPLRSHSAENSIRYEQENILCKWKNSGIEYFIVKLGFVGCGVIVNIVLSIALIYEYLLYVGNNKCILLLIYWVLNLSELGIQLANVAGSYPGIRNRILRILEPIHTREEKKLPQNTCSNNFSKEIQRSSGMKINIKEVNVLVGEQSILSDINLLIHPGEHVAIVGPSGAGKSTLMRLLLGFYSINTGEIQIDDKNFLENIYSIRRETAWIDPSVHIWNRTLADNIVYGNEKNHHSELGIIMEQAGLIKILNNLPHGNETQLGEAGKLVSGGEGQRVRLGRGMYKKDVRCVILDEPFRGLSGQERSHLLKKALEYWKFNTLIFISHDVKETLNFDRVLVIEKGKIVEDDSPEILFNKQGSRYKSIINNEEKVKSSFFKNVQWKRLWVENGKLIDNR